MDTPPPAPEANFSSEYTENLPALLGSLGISLAVSTYQAGRLILVRAKDGVINTHFRHFEMPMGLAYRQGWLALGTKREIWQFRNFSELGALLEKEQKYDAVFLPGLRHVTGDIRGHEMAWAGDELWVVNTRFSSLCMLDGKHSFVPRWRPPFIKELSEGDHCHLNGLAIANDAPAYVTCHAETSTTTGWRDHKANGGCIIDVPTGETVLRGLSMPHSPRIHDGRLWFCESGHGRICTMDPATRAVTVMAELPGFTRGLDFFGGYAFVGLSEGRESAVFSGISIAEEGRERRCGVWVLNAATGAIVAFLRFSGIVQEIFSVQYLPFAFPEVINEHHEMTDHAFFIPPQKPAAD